MKPKVKKLFLKIITLVITGIVVYLIRMQLFGGTAEVNVIIRVAGIVIGLFAVLYLIMEEKMNLSFFYGKSQSAGSNANASVVAGLSTALIAQSWLEILLGSLVWIGLMLLIFLIVKGKTA